MSIRRVGAVFALAVAFALAGPTFAGYAGGWAVATLDESPPSLAAGHPVTIGYTIRQHGKTPVNVEGSAITARLGSEVVTFPGRQQGPVGHYVAEVNLPRGGVWTWEVNQGWFAPHPLGTLTVADRSAATTAVEASLVLRALLGIAAAAVLFLLVRQVLALRGRAQRAQIG